MDTDISSELVEFKQLEVTENHGESEFHYSEVVISKRKSKGSELQEQKLLGSTPVKPSIIVTGFGPLHPRYPRENISGTIMQDFHAQHSGVFRHLSEEIDIVTGPKSDPSTDPMVCSYEYINGNTPEHFNDWLQKSDARLYVHLGIKTNNDHTTNPLYFETFANNMPVDPDTNEPIQWKADYRKCYNNGEPCVIKGKDVLETSFDIPSLIRRISGSVGDLISLRQSPNAGNFLCDFLYYRSLYYANNIRGNANVLFIHVPSDLFRGVTTQDIASVLDNVVHCLLDMLATSDKEPLLLWPDPDVLGPIYWEPVPRSDRDEPPVFGPIYVDPAVPRRDRDKPPVFGPIYVDPAVPRRDRDEPPMYSDPVYVKDAEEKELYAVVRRKKEALSRRGTGVDEREQVTYAEVEVRKGPVVKLGDIGEEQLVQYSEIKREIGTSAGGSALEEKERMKRTAAAHTPHKKQTRNSRRKRRQKRNARQRKRK